MGVALQSTIHNGGVTMKAVFIGSDPKIQKKAATSLRLRWPDDTNMSAAENAADGVALVEETSPDVVLIHPDFQDMPLSQVIERLRSFSNVPILVFGFQNDEMEVVTALETGADDYVRLPCDLTEIIARVAALLRRAESSRLNNGLNHIQEGPIQSGPLFINPSTYEVFLEGQRLTLTSTEFRLLHVFTRNRGQVVKRQALERIIWGEQVESTGLVKKYIQRLRKKLGDNSRAPRWIATVHGVGYQFVGPLPQATEQMAG